MKFVIKKKSPTVPGSENRILLRPAVSTLLAQRPKIADFTFRAPSFYTFNIL